MVCENNPVAVLWGGGAAQTWIWTSYHHINVSCQLIICKQEKNNTNMINLLPVHPWLLWSKRYIANLQDSRPLKTYCSLGKDNCMKIFSLPKPLQSLTKDLFKQTIYNFDEQMHTNRTSVYKCHRKCRVCLNENGEKKKIPNTPLLTNADLVSPKFRTQICSSAILHWHEIRSFRNVERVIRTLCCMWHKSWISFLLFCSWISC